MPSRPAGPLSQRLRAIVPYLVVLAVALLLYARTTQFQYTPHAGRLGPDVWPRTVLVLMALVCAVRIAVGLWRPAVAEADGGVLEEVTRDVHALPAAAVPDERYPWLLLLGIALTVAYVFALGWMGFAVATTFYLAAMIRTGRYTRWRVIIPTAVIGSLSFMFVFMKIVYLSLPIGQPPFESVSLLLMRLMGIR